ncbi:MAG: hypothetical protein ACR2MT_13935 [Aurantibacter sp.]
MLVALGLAVMVFSVVLMFVFPTEVPQMPDGFSVPIIAYEFLQTDQEVMAFFGVEGKPRDQLVSAMNLGHVIDYFFLVFYSGFLTVWGVFCVRLTSNKLFYSVTFLAIIAAFGDLFENIQLVKIANTLENGVFVAELKNLFLFTWVKWGALALTFPIIGICIFKFGWFGKTIAFLGWLTLILGVVAFADRSLVTALFAKGVSLLFLLLFVLSILVYFGKVKYINDTDARASF